MDLCAPCDSYRREGWGEWLQLEDCCLNCSHLDDPLPCPTLAARIYPCGPATRPVEGGDPKRGIPSSSTCAGCEGSGAGGDVS